MKFIGMTVRFREGKAKSSKRHDGAEIDILRLYLVQASRTNAATLRQ